MLYDSKRKIERNIKTKLQEVLLWRKNPDTC